jgi:hypothetical protein
MMTRTNEDLKKRAELLAKIIEKEYEVYNNRNNQGNVLKND